MWRRLTILVFSFCCNWNWKANNLTKQDLHTGTSTSMCGTSEFGHATYDSPYGSHHSGVAGTVPFIFMI